MRNLFKAGRINANEIHSIFDRLEEKVGKEMMKAKFAEVNDSVKYIATLDTHEILWMNDTLKSMLGEDVDLKEKKCFEILQDLPVPCEFCTNSELTQEGKVKQWTHFNKKLGKVFLVRDFLVIIEGKRLRFENAIDITKQLETLKSYG